MRPVDSAPFRRELAAALPERPFAVAFWDGAQMPATNGGGPTIQVRSPRALAHALRAPGQLGLGRAYVAGELDAEALDEVIELIYRWRPPPVTLRARARLALAAAGAVGLKRLPAPPAVELRSNGHRRHDREHDARAVRHHYDVSNDFFALFLDPSMTYSCALFRDGATTLEQAQQAKLDLICRKLALAPGDRMLDVGCGWGSLALHAAACHGARVVGITLAERQAQLARERVHEQGLEDRVEIRLMDYRDLGGERFDAIASVGMVEHVGEAQIDAYAAALARALEPGGRLLNHGISALGAGNDMPSEFTDRFIFPDGQLLHLPRVLGALEGAGFEIEHVEGLHRHYEQTLAHWARRLDEHLDDAVRLAGAERVRVWRLYLRAARENFRSDYASVYQVLCVRAAADGETV